MSGNDNTSYTTRTVSAASTLTANDYAVFCVASSAYAVTLPDSESIQPGRPYHIVKDNTGAFAITVTPFDAADTINGATTLVLASGAYHGCTLVNDGDKWWATALY